MELKNEFRVGVPIEQAWAVLTDVERIAPCLPGAQLQEIEGDEYRGIVKIKVGPISAQYKGQATMIEKDDIAHKAVLKAEGRDTRGQGNASATVTATLTADGDGTAVIVVTDLSISGKVAQFGRGVLADVSAKLLTTFVENLERDVLAAGAASVAAAAEPTEAPIVETGGAPIANGSAGAATKTDTALSAEAPPAATPVKPTVRKIDAPSAAPVDLLDAAGGATAKRLIPVGIVVILILFILRRRRNRRLLGFTSPSGVV